MSTLGRPVPNDRYDTYTKTEVDAKDSVLDAKGIAQDDVIALKADQATTYTKAETDGLVTATVPAGTMIEFAGTVAPTGYLVMDGSELSETTYANLFAAIGTAWNTTGGVGAPVAGNFRLPPSQIGNLGLYKRGVGVTNGAVGTYQADVFKTHTHSLPLYGHSTSSGVGQAEVSTSASFYNNKTTTATGDATETRPRSITVLMCIKY